MKHLMKHLSAPLAFVLTFLAFGTPSAPLADSLLPSSGDCLAYAGGDDGMGESGCVDLANYIDYGNCFSCSEASDAKEFYEDASLLLAGVTVVAAPFCIPCGVATALGGLHNLNTARQIDRAMEDAEC